MKRSDQVLLGAFITLIGIALIAPNETSKVLTECSKDRKPNKTPASESNPTKYGIIRRSFSAIISGIKKFWRWLY
jgi:hypothetical protein